MPHYPIIIALLNLATVHNQNEMSSSFLPPPEIIITNILHRLPTKTLLRCTVVCKSWYSLITSPQFISSHFNFKHSFSSLVLLLRRSFPSSDLYDLYSDDHESFTHLCGFEFPFKPINSCFTIVGNCNGLLCLSDDRVYFTNTIILWNPCLRRSILLPKPRLVYNCLGTYIQCLGFGLGSMASDYKVIRITYVDCNENLELYRLSSGVWEDMSHLKCGHVIYNRSRQAFVNGAVHWVASCRDGYDLIVLFDMSREVFREMMLPGSLVKNDPMRCKDLVVFRESLALVMWNVSSEESSFCVWVMNEYGVEESWAKHLRFDCCEFGIGGYVRRPLWVRKCGGVIAVLEDGRLVCCGADEAKVEILEVNGYRSEEYKRLIHVDGYVESLVLLDRCGAHFDEICY